MTPRMMIIQRLLEEAKANDDMMVANVCRRLIRADRLGWAKHRDPADMKIVKAFTA